MKQLEVNELSLRDAIELTITLSDNVATNALLERCDAERVNAYLASVGLPHTRVLGPIDFTHHARRHGGIGISTPREQMTLLTALERCEILNAQLCTYLRTILERQHYQDRVLGGSAGTRMRSTTAVSRF